MTSSPFVSFSSTRRDFSDTYSLPSTYAMPMGSCSPSAIFLAVTRAGEVVPVTPLSRYTSPSRFSEPPQVVTASRPPGSQAIAVTCGSNPAGRRSVRV